MKNLLSHKTAIQFTTNEPQSCVFCERGKTFLYKIHPGSAFGVAFHYNIGLGISLGMLFGLVIGSGIRKPKDPNDQEHQSG